MGVNSLPKTVTRQRRGCHLNPGLSATESSMLTTRLPSHQFLVYMYIIVLLHNLFSNSAHVRNKISCQLYHIAAVGTISGSRVYFKDFFWTPQH